MKGEGRGGERVRGERENLHSEPETRNQEPET
jgi:hypothetical protein